jgi:hypothetical protein
MSESDIRKFPKKADYPPAGSEGQEGDERIVTGSFRVGGVVTKQTRTYKKIDGRWKYIVWNEV